MHPPLFNTANAFCALLTLAFVVSAAAPAQAAQEPSSANSTRNATVSAASAATAPAKAAVKKPARPKRRLVTRWSKDKRRQARARCARLLQGLDVVVKPLSPIRRNACGSAAPVKLIAIGSNPRVTLSPAPIVNCDMAAAMHKWLKRDLQPMARKYLKAPLKRLGIMSSYSCRAAYGKRGNRLSQHARANALDIRSFETSGGLLTAVLSDWGPRRRYRARLRNITARRGPLNNRTKGHPKQYRAAKPGSWATTINRPSAHTNKAARDIAAGTPVNPVLTASSLLKSIFAVPGSQGDMANGADTVSSAILPSQNRLGGPRRKSGFRPQKAAFLHEIHRRACTIFGTVLGPNADYTHRNHFHVDLQKRKLGPYCR